MAFAAADRDDIVVFWGPLVHSQSTTKLDILSHALVAFNPHDSGKILAFEPDVPSRAQLAPALASLGLASDHAVRELAHGQLLVPGFVDTHNHAPQWTQRGSGQGMQILDWLDEITFPSEARFADPAYARRWYDSLVRGMLRQGVTTASYYGSMHGEATRILADVCLRRGQRALVGKCNMDRNAPDYYRDASPDESLAVTHECIRHIRAIDPAGAYVRPVLTPRFAITCDPEVLTGLGAIMAAEPDMPMQTHFNEAQQERSFTLSLFPDFDNEADLYEHYGLLTRRSILAHCTIMTPYETGRLRDLGCGVAHCPTANMTVGGGFMAAPIKEFLRQGINVGLGTDSGGGYSSSMLDSIRHSMIASYARDALYDQDNKTKPESDAVAATAGGSGATLSLEEVFYLATLGGAKVVGLDEQIGSFAVGKHFDALLVDVTDDRGGVNAPLEEADSLRIVFEKFIMTGDDRNVAEVYVKGNKK